MVQLRNQQAGGRLASHLTLAGAISPLSGGAGGVSSSPSAQSLSCSLPTAIGVSGGRALHSRARQPPSPILGRNRTCPRERNAAAVDGAVADRSDIVHRCSCEAPVEAPSRCFGKIKLPLPMSDGTVRAPPPAPGDRNPRRLTGGVSIDALGPRFCPCARLRRVFLAR